MHKRISISCLFCAIFLAFGITDSATERIEAQSKQELQKKLTDCLKCYTDLLFDKGISLAQELLTYDYLTARDSIAILEAMAINTYAMGPNYKNKSFSYLDMMSGIGPCLINLPRDKWNKELRNRWYRINKEKGILTCPKDTISGIRTIAFMPFDNFSIEKFLLKHGHLSKGLAEFFVNDFRKISSLQVVERGKIDLILEEHELQKSGSVDKSTAIEIGKILGAQLMVFGSITQLNDKHTRMVARVVNVETSEIIASVDIEGKPRYFELEKELVKELADNLEIELSKKTIDLIEQGGTKSEDAATYFVLGLDYMDKYDYSKAYENFKKAYELDDDFIEAKDYMDTYKPLVGWLVNN